VKELELKPYDAHVLVCQGSKCSKHDSKEIYKELRHHFKHEQLPLRVSRVDCFDECKQACVVVVEGKDTTWFGEAKGKHKHVEAIKEEVMKALTSVSP
jgi:NADH:ubiquinone oxidoreductase subunit E